MTPWCLAAPDLDWDYTLDISNFSPAAPGFTIQGIHDCYPAYEFYLNNTQGVYGYLPPRNDFNYAINCLYAWLDMTPSGLVPTQDESIKGGVIQ